ncbi:MAG TPA: rRNA maturation RNase YbeY [Spirochaetia bacterium]|nr:rRNA maturation RNase YbeY [Spirochaetia bacterium]
MKATKEQEKKGLVRSVELAVEGIRAPQWRGTLRRFCALVMEEVRASEWELSVLLCDDARMKRLNARYRGKDIATDVLSFPAETRVRTRAASLTGAAVKGDIAISIDTLRSNARRFGVSDDEELKRLLIHGILHCAGMDHGSGRSGSMLSLQERLLGALKEVRIIGK